jgi:DNA-binding CsgD family transcriptional regulator
MLVGREAESRELTRLLRRAASGTTGACVVRGEPGVGKTALLEFAAEEARAFLTVSARGVESESEFAFAGLVGICRPLRSHLSGVPDRQRDALESALAVSRGPVVDRFTAFAGFLTLIGSAAEEQPVLLLVDDLQWLDRASAEAILFAARRLRHDRVAIVMSSRLGEDDDVDLDGVPQIRLAGLSREASLRVLRRHDGSPMPVHVARRLVELTGGLPLALLEVPALLTADQVRGEAPLPDPLPVGHAVKEAFRRELAELPSPCIGALQLVAADDTGSVDALADALAIRGLTMAVLEPAERSDLLRIRAGRAEFRHPILRSVVYHGAPPVDRRRAHRDLGRAYVGRDRARHVWHQAAAAQRPNELIAAALAESAFDARARGAYASAASALERAAELTPDDRTRGDRLREAGTAAWLDGQPHRALRSLDAALELTDDPVMRVDVHEVRGRLFYMTGSMVDAIGLLVAEGLRVQHIAPEKAVAMLTLACSVCSGAALMNRGLETARQATAIARRLGEGPQLLAALALAQTLILSGRGREGLRILRKWRPVCASYFAAPLTVPFDPVAGLVYFYADYHFARQLLDTFHEEARSRSPEMLPQVLGSLTDLEMRLGDWALALAHGSEGVELAAVTNQPTTQSWTLANLATVEAGMGREEARTHATMCMELASRSGTRSMVVYALRVNGLLDLGRGHVGAAVSELEEVGRLMRDWGARDLQVVPWMPDLIEAHVHAGDDVRARRLVRALRAQSIRDGTRWSAAIAARCLGLVAEDFDEPFARALELHDGVPTPFDRARTELAYAERLRRSGRRREARPHLHAAIETFDRLGAAPWKARAEAELGGTAPHVGSRRDPAERLSPQELQVALVVGGGATNREAAAALFVTAKTIEFHLSHIYRKLGIRSRSELARVVATRPITLLSSGR